VLALSSYNLNLRLESIRTITIIAVDILIMWLVFYYAIKLVRSNSRTIQIFKGILLVILVDGIAKFFGLKTLEFFADIFLNWGFLAIIIVFQPEIRILLEKLGKTNVFSRINTLTGNEKENLVDQIVKATMLLSQDQTGALISIEQSHSLEDFITTGTKLNSDVTAELLTSIFVTSTPLHDGAVIIQGSRIACASAYFPPTNLELPSRYGARHRAAIGISEITDAVTIVVSEETGAISITEGGKIFRVNTKQLRDYLMRVICGEETEVQASRKKTQEPAVPGREILIEEDIHSGEVALPKKEDKAVKRQETGVLSKLTLKKQPDKNTSEKIEVEEVVSPAHEPEETHEERKGLFAGLFSKKEENITEENRLKELEEELNEIKLPKKKERPVPSYPEHEHRTEESGRIHPVSIHPEEHAEAVQEDVSAFAAEAEEENRRMTPEEVQAARERSLEKLKQAELTQDSEPEEPAEGEPEIRRMTPEEVKAARERSLKKLKQAEQPQISEPEEPAEEEPEKRRMTPEEVQAARERSLEKLTGKKPIPQVMKPVEPVETEEDIIPSEVKERSEEERMFDTSKLDISKLMGFDDDFDSTFRMVDHLDTEADKTSGNRKGGE